MSDETITFDDGYTATFSGDTVAVEFSGKVMRPINVTHFKPVPFESKLGNTLLAKGLPLDDYLWANAAGEVVIRSGNGIGEKIKAMAERINTETAMILAQRKAEFEAKKGDAFSASGFRDPVQVTLARSDKWGWNLSVYVDEDFNDYGKVEDPADVFEQDGLAVMERHKFEAIKADRIEHRRKVEEAKAERERLAQVELESKFAQAKATGEKVKIKSYMTSRCMSGNGAECSFDQAVEFAMPSGKITTQYACCY